MKEKGAKIVAECLMGKIIHNRKVHVDGLRIAIKVMWRTTREVKIESLGDNIFMFRFENKTDKRRVLAGGPWHFNRALIVLTEPSGIGDAKLKEVETDSSGECIGKFVILRISADVTKPLKKVVVLTQEDVDNEEANDDDEDKEDISILVVYEKLPDFCFYCGCIEQQYKECVYYKSQSKDELAYG
ncbi:hypothetical protein AB3S75_007063 [Citrus x aurantiifolia]